MIIRYLTVLAVILLFAFVVYIIKESEKISLLETFLPEKLAVFRNVHMSGIEASGEAWEVYAKEAWTGRDKFTTVFENVTNASIAEDGRFIIKNLRARRMRIARNKDIEIIKRIDDKDASYLRVYIDFGAISSPPKKEMRFSYLTADNIKFNPDTKKAAIQGNIKVIKEKLVTIADKIALDLNSNTATFEGRSSFSKESARLYSDSATAFFDEDRIDMAGSVEVVQKNKRASSGYASYDDNTKEIAMVSNVRAVIEKLRNVMKKETAKKYDTEEEQRSLSTLTSIACEKLVFNTDDNNAQAFGSVYVTQTSKEARSEQAFYNEKDENIIMTGNVIMKRDGDWVKAEKVIVSVKNETFDAIGGAETTFKVKKGSR